MRQAFNLNTPTFIISQMPVEHVKFVVCQLIDHSFDLLKRVKMAGAIEHHTAILKARCIDNVDQRKAQ
ncbi:Uncharacterised protein [Vibrio cholerae]|uniref:Uncharacterized protein n=1 Tax=Vibrio cholerae TaxID=666 RepID=A0A655ZPH7_VIBCL|nr:Uncharacterised protein [Vibrio cholerae]CSB28188.1 Uncharacterised protein [Vibrio cholerae]CSB94925.1 Uncharacterised protein [Vibrio cholerae]CSC60135.1 Uncharacterised protein [Vibrio cholerae]CSC75994.1 Uncharacterised protein [Vibrio cholerae]